MDRLLLVANPAASGFTGGLHRTICRILSRRWEVHPAWPQSADHARALTAEAVQAGCPLVVATGGDGIVHHVAQAVAGTETVLGIIPVGTTNVYARLAGLPRRPSAAAKMLASGYDVSATPVVWVTAEGGDGNAARWVTLFALGVGHDAEIVRRAEAEPYRKYRFGSLHYARTAVATVWSELRRVPLRLHLEGDGVETDTAGLMVQFHDTYTFFGRAPLRLGPRGGPPMTVLAIDALRLRRTPVILRRILAGDGMQGVKGIRVWSGVRRLTVRAKDPVLTQADGELRAAWRKLELRYVPDGLAVATPPSPTG